MITQTLAILLDAYRDLNARRLFWITLALSGVLVLVFAMVGITPHGLSFLKWRIAVFDPEFVYKTVFIRQLLINVWLTWAASILALVSTAGIFPDFLASGAIDLYLSKPLGRLRLFITKYLAGLMFVALQVSLVSGGVFLAMGARTGQWTPGLFLTIPLVLCFFSYIYAVCVLLGIVTRSTVASILLASVAWFAFFGVQMAEQVALQFQYAHEFNVERYTAAIDRSRAEIDKLHGRGLASNLFGLRTTSLKEDIARWTQLRDEERGYAHQVGLWHKGAYALLAITPKTSGTIGLLDRALVSPAELAPNDDEGDADEPADSGSLPSAGAGVMQDFAAMQVSARRVKLTLRDRSLWWTLGTSLGVEALIVAGAAAIFLRRDF